MQQQNRQLAAILFTDIVGYTAMMQQDEEKAVAIVKRYISVLKQALTVHRGKMLNDYGDGNLCIFPSATEAVKAAFEIQLQLQAEPSVLLRIGLHSGEIFFEDGKVMGDAINVASRIQSLGRANTILFSAEINNKIKNQPGFKATSLGHFEFKNVNEPMEVFALANEGLIVPKKEQMSGKLKEIKKTSIRKKIMLIIAALVLLVTVFLVYKKLGGAKGFTGEKTIAVLPFENIGTDNSEEYLSDGITQDIISNLSKISSLKKVIGWFSVRNFKKTTQTVKQIAGELNVTAILTGSIQRQAGKIHIIAELIDISTNKRLWGYDYNYDSKDLLSIQTNVAGEIVAALKASLTPEEKKGLSKHYTENIEAYKLYRKGRFFWDQRSPGSFDSAENYYRKAIDSDPDYALAYAGLADCYTINQKGMSQMEAIPIAREFAAKALSLDSTLTEARTTMAFIQSQFDYDWKGAKVVLQKIIRDNPNYTFAHLYYGNALLYTGNIEEGLDETKKALSLDPLFAVPDYVLGRNYYYARKYDSAIGQLQKALTVNPKFSNSNVPLGQSFLQKRLYPKAIDAFSKLPMKPWDQGNNGLLLLCYAYELAGDMTKAKSLLEQVSADDRLKCPYFMAYVYLGMGDPDEALTQLENAYKVHSIIIGFLKLDPVFDPIHNDTRFKALLKKTGLE